MGSKINMSDTPYRFFIPGLRSGDRAKRIAAVAEWMRRRREEAEPS